MLVQTQDYQIKPLTDCGKHHGGRLINGLNRELRVQEVIRSPLRLEEGRGDLNVLVNVIVLEEVGPFGRRWVTWTRLFCFYGHSFGLHLE